jgi:hypothetical protein
MSQRYWIAPFVLTLACGALDPSVTASVHDYAVEVSATVHESPPRIDFTWPADATAEQYYVFKKAVGDSAWGDPLTVLPGSATAFSDADVEVGNAFEYSFQKNLGAYRHALTVPGGTAATFTIYDTWGDGICCHHGLGSYTVTGCGHTYAAGGEFGTQEMTSFTTDGSCAELVVTVTPDVYGAETTWILTEDGTGEPLGSGGPYESPRFGHIVAGIRYPAVEERGTVLVLVEESVAAGLNAELPRLRCDLVGDGYRVRMRTVSSADDVTLIKELILAECAADPAIGTLLVLGNVPVPYSGDVWSGHAEHCGAWPADVYYAELDGEWTDEYVHNTTAARPENHNVPGDGKFDQTWLPSDVDLQLGRVDLSNMPAFSLSEVELLQRYLDKDHAFRTGQTRAEERGLIDDNVGELYGRAPATTGWRNFATMFGAEHIDEGDFFPDLETESYLWAYGCGGSSYTYCGGVGGTEDFATREVRAVFTSLYGSYFGDWDNRNNVLRAPLGAQGYPLVCFWSGRPIWNFQHMALGFPIGHGARLSQNNNTLYRIGDGTRVIHIALMGDPTLRLHAVRPVTDLQLEEVGDDAIRLTWQASSDPVEGYHVYRAETLPETFERLTTTPLGDTTFVDTGALSTNNVYMVRALRLQTTSSGSYYDLSCGAIDSLRLAASAEEQRRPALALSVHPSPVSSGANLRLELPQPCFVRLQVHDVTGGIVRRLVHGQLHAGIHEIAWDGTDDSGRRVASGTYFLRLTTGRGDLSRRITLLR